MKVFSFGLLIPRFVLYPHSLAGFASHLLFHEHVLLLLEISKQDQILLFIKLQFLKPLLRRFIENANQVEQKCHLETPILSVPGHCQRGVQRSECGSIISGPGAPLTPSTFWRGSIFCENSADQKEMLWQSELKMQIPQAWCHS